MIFFETYVCVYTWNQRILVFLDILLLVSAD
jgi:hypothetical protein